MECQKNAGYGPFNVADTRSIKTSLALVSFLWIQIRTSLLGTICMTLELLHPVFCKEWNENQGWQERPFMPGFPPQA